MAEHPDPHADPHAPKPHAEVLSEPPSASDTALGGYADINLPLIGLIGTVATLGVIAIILFGQAGYYGAVREEIQRKSYGQANLWYETLRNQQEAAINDTIEPAMAEAASAMVEQAQ